MVIVFDQESEVSDVDHVIFSRKMLWNWCQDIHGIESHVGRQPFPWRKLSICDIEAIQLDRRGQAPRQRNWPYSFLPN